ncbi:MAG: serine O-acetyltransferase [Kiritimatiellia bacterium]
MSCHENPSPSVDPGALICKTIQQLVPHYRHDQQDDPQSVLAQAPNPANIIEGHRVLIDLMLPGRLSQGNAPDAHELEVFLMRRMTHAWRMLRAEVERAIPYRWYGQAARTEGPPPTGNAVEESENVMKAFLARMPAVLEAVVHDIRAAYDGDPAALTYAEVQLAYPGLLAVAAHRIAHELYRLDVPIVPRIMSEWVHSQTGADIHPGATIGQGLFIDHATGVVIGETTTIGHRVKIYQGVTLGARSFPLDANGNPIKHVKRHPTVEDDVVIYSHATILGGDTVIGRGATIGGNVFLMDSVPAGSMVTSVHPELKVKSRPGAQA